MSAMSESTRLRDDIEELPSLESCERQHQNLLKDMDIVEEVSPHTDGKPVCQACAINTRIIPCVYLCVCHDCVKRLINTD